MNIRRMAGTIAACVTAAAFAEVDVDTVTMTQDLSSRLVTINYALSAQPAVVTLDIETNIVVDGATVGWASIGGEHIWNAQGDVWKKVTTTAGVITWQADQLWTGTDGKGFRVDGGTYKARAKVTAWALDNTPDYMVVDLTATGGLDTQRYYPAVEFIPGGILGRDEYRTSLLVMRKIMAKDVTWVMGDQAIANNFSAPHQVMLTNNYYIGVFEFTQAQWMSITGARKGSYSAEYQMRPVETVSFNALRMSASLNNTAAADAQEWPGAPKAGSFLALLNDKTKLDFDLPSEAQWEFAACAGNAGFRYGRSDYSSGNQSLMGRYGYTATSAGGTLPAEGGTAIVGSYLPNDWGLYDTLGNVSEWCLDWFRQNISQMNGVTWTDEADSGTVSGNKERLLRGGAYNTEAYMPSFRNIHSNPASTGNTSYLYGFRVLCRAGLK